MWIAIEPWVYEQVDRTATTPGKACENNANSYCGLRDSKYPDRRSMGYPFDRLPRDGVNTLTEFLVPNMIVTDVTIKYSDRTVVPKPRPAAQAQGQRNRG